jgi:hypothetical protein
MAELSTEYVPTDADVDEALARLWPPGYWEKMLASVRKFIEANKAKGYRATTTAMLLRDSMATSLKELEASDSDAEVVFTTFNRAIDRILSEEVRT